MSKDKDNKPKTNAGGLGVLLSRPKLLYAFMLFMYFVDYYMFDQSTVGLVAPQLRAFDQKLPWGLTELLGGRMFNPVAFGLWCIIQVTEAVLFTVVVLWGMYFFKPEKLKMPDEERFLWLMKQLTVVAVLFGIPAAMYDWGSVAMMLTDMMDMTMPVWAWPFLFGVAPFFVVFGQELIGAATERLRTAMLKLSEVELAMGQQADTYWNTTKVEDVIFAVGGQLHHIDPQDMQLANQAKVIEEIKKILNEATEGDPEEVQILVTGQEEPTVIKYEKDMSRSAFLMKVRIALANIDSSKKEEPKEEEKE